jgi:hypothetical protein
MLLPLVKKKIEEKFGSPIRYPKDCDALANAISKACKCKISNSTIKRLFGIIKGSESPRLWTLDLIGLYLGFDSYTDLISHLTDNKAKRKDRLEIIISKNLTKGRSFNILCGQSISIVIENLGKGSYRVLGQTKTVLFANDILEIEKIQMHFPVLIKSIKRDGDYLDGIFIGAVTGVTAITEIKSHSDVELLLNNSLNSNN